VIYDIPLEDFQSARARLVPYIRHTPVLAWPSVHQDQPPGLRLKLENLQVMGSFKPRGVFNNMRQLDPDQRQRGVVAASAGNHGLAVAYVANQLRIPATIYLPAVAIPDRVARIQAWGAHVIQYGDVYDDAQAEAMAHASVEGLAYVPSFDSEPTLAGHGTLALELLEDVPELDCILVAIGGGGLIAGVACALKQLNPQIRIIGVEPTGAPSMYYSVQAGHMIDLPETRTIADTLSTRTVCERTLALTQRYVDEIVMVTDTQIIHAMRWLWAECNQLVEPSGAAALAAALCGVAELSAYQHPVALICGGNAGADSVWQVYEGQARAKGTLE
jgi:threonine dehydratase